MSKKPSNMQEYGGFHLVPANPSGRTSRIFERLIPYAGGGFAKSYTIYLSGTIGHEQDYIAEINLLRNIVQEGDEVTVYINSGGGSVYTGWQFTNAMADCAVPVKTVLDGACMSMAAIIFLCGNHVEINKGGLFMIHDVSHSNYGKQGGEVKPYIEGLERQIMAHYSQVLLSFLTEDEFKLMSNGTDLYFTPEEVHIRITQRNKQAEEAMKKAEAAAKKAEKEAVKTPTRRPRKTTRKINAVNKNKSRGSQSAE